MATRKLLIGNDARFRWPILQEDGSEYDLSGKSLVLYIRSDLDAIRVADFTTDGNDVLFTFYGARQSFPGLYNAVLIERRGRTDMITVQTSSVIQLVLDPADEWPEFVQPTGAHDAYAKGTKVTYKGQHYISLIDANVYSPEAYPQGWQLAD